MRAIWSLPTWTQALVQTLVGSKDIVETNEQKTDKRMDRRTDASDYLTLPTNAVGNYNVQVVTLSSSTEVHFRSTLYRRQITLLSFLYTDGHCVASSKYSSR